MLRRELFSVLVLAAVVRLVLAAWGDSMDFVVYWTAAHAWLTGEPNANPYLFNATIQGFVLKYPPWIVPLFAPLGLLPYAAARLLWAGIELLSLGYALRWLFRAGVDLRVLWGSAFLFWWIWLGHFYAGQITIVLLAVALWTQDSQNKDKKGARALGIAWVLFSSKVFSCLSLLGQGRRNLSLKVWTWAGALVLGLGSLCWLGIRLHGVEISPLELLQSWMAAANSGGTDLGDRIIRGQMNHGFTAGILRALNIPASDKRWDGWVALAVFGALAWGWRHFSKKLTEEESWTGWLAIGLIAHPLAWHHSYVLTFPLCALALDRGLRVFTAPDGRRTPVILAGISFVCIGLLIPNILGMTIVTPLELISIKSWGVLFALVSLILAKRSSVQKSLSQ